jgi:hypothetical protein
MVATLKYKLWCNHMILYMRSYFLFQAHKKTKFIDQTSQV